VELSRISIADIVVPDVRVTAIYDDEAIEKMRGTCRALGIQGTVILVKVGDKYEVADGKNRIDRALEMGETTIEAAVTEGSPKDTLLVNLALTKSHGKSRVSDMVQVIKELADVHGMGPDDIRDATGLSREYIEKIMKISGASQSVLEAIDQEIIGVGHAYELSRLPSTIQQDEVVARHQVWRFTVRELKEQVDMVLKEMEFIQNAPVQVPLREDPPPRVVKCDGCLTITEPRDLRSVLICPSCYTDIWRAAQARKLEAAKSEDDTGGG